MKGRHVSTVISGRTVLIYEDATIAIEKIKGRVYDIKKPKISGGRYRVNIATFDNFDLATLVAKHFIPNPKGYPLVGFKDNNALNCTVDNLFWTSSGNYKARKSGRNYAHRAFLVLGYRNAILKAFTNCAESLEYLDIKYSSILMDNAIRGFKVCDELLLVQYTSTQPQDDSLPPKKVCPDCNKILDLENFTIKDKHRPSGIGRLNTYCKKCTAARMAKYRRTNSDIQKSSNK